MAFVPPALTQGHLSRLAFVRHLYRQAIEQASQPHPLRVSALLSLHDAVELFLGIACEAAKATVTPRTGFHDYLKLLKDAGVVLQHETPVIRLNTARVGLKHHGIIPDNTAVDEFLAATGQFLADNTSAVWNASFSSVSLVTLVADPDVRARLEECEQLLANGQTCTHQMSAAFAVLLHAAGHGDPVWKYRFNPRIRDLEMVPNLDPTLKYYLASIHGAVDNLREAVTVLSLQLDYQRYVRFDLNSYPAHIGSDGQVHVTGIPLGLGVEQCREGVDFVIDCALRIQGRRRL